MSTSYKEKRKKKLKKKSANIIITKTFDKIYEMFLKIITTREQNIY